jgi:hypothetical protein
MVFRTFFILSVVAHAYDDQSLMQQGVGIETSVLSEAVDSEFRAGVASMKAMLKDVPMPGKMRQMAIDALMQSVTKAQRLSPESSTALNSIVALFDQILAQFITEKNADMVSINGHQAVADTCNSAGTATLTNAQTTMNDNQQTHTDCRTTQVTLTNAEATACAALQAALSTAADSLLANCNSLDTVNLANVRGNYIDVYQRTGFTGMGSTTTKVDATSGNSLSHVSAHAVTGSANYDTISSFLSNGVAWFSTQETLMTNDGPGCADAIESRSDKDTECDTAQNTFESSVCVFNTQQTNTCGTRTTCIASASAAYTADYNTRLVESDERVTVAQVIVLVKCMAQAMVSTGVVDETACATVRDGHDYTVYQITDPGCCTADSCLAAVSPQPGDATWLNGYDAAWTAFIDTSVTAC